ncbi:hypothetical protein BUE93_22310, partial [Chromobacterium amazonense]
MLHSIKPRRSIGNPADRRFCAGPSDGGGEERCPAPAVLPDLRSDHILAPSETLPNHQLESLQPSPDPARLLVRLAGHK